MNAADRQELRALATRAAQGRPELRAVLGSRKRWQLQTSNSFRRIGTEMGDGDVLCATTHPRDHHPDLMAAPGVLEYVVAAQPEVVLGLLNDLETLERAMHVTEDLLKTDLLKAIHALDAKLRATGDEASSTEQRSARTFKVDEPLLWRILDVLAGVGPLPVDVWRRNHTLLTEIMQMLSAESP